MFSDVLLQGHLVNPELPPDITLLHDKFPKGNSVCKEQDRSHIPKQVSLPLHSLCLPLFVVVSGLVTLRIYFVLCYFVVCLPSVP